jgi:DNA polymerase-3 subunit delta
MWYLYHGPNDIARNEELARLMATVGDAQYIALNTTRLDSSAQVKDIESACDTYSFLADKRMVIVRNWFSKSDQPRRRAGKDQDETLKRLLDYLPEIPESTLLVFIEDATLPDSHPLVKAGNAQDGAGHVKLFDLPKDAVTWITQRAKQKGGEIALAAAKALATRINRGNPYDRDHYVEDARLYMRKLDNELDKLVAYALGRKIENADVLALVAEEEVSDMFQFIDAVSMKDGQLAYRLMQGILARGESPLVVMTMLARQTRLMIAAKENEQLSPDQLAQTIGVHPFVAKKIVGPAKRFRMAELVRAHLALADADLDVKTGRMEDVAALDMLVALLCDA